MYDIYIYTYNVMGRGLRLRRAPWGRGESEQGRGAGRLAPRPGTTTIIVIAMYYYILS